MMLPNASQSAKPCSIEMANTSSADRNIASAPAAPYIAQSPSQEWYRA